MSASTPAANQDDICQRCSYSRWAHINAFGILPEICTNFEELPAPDPLVREPDYDFAEFRQFCEDTKVDLAHADIAFVMWLHTRAAKAQLQP